MAEKQSAAYDQGLIKELTEIAPGAVDEARAASDAYRHGRWQEVFDRYAHVFAAAPTFTHALRRQCRARLELGDRAAALLICRKAVEAAATPENQLALAYALITRNAGSEPGQSDLNSGALLARQAFDGSGSDLMIAEGACEISLRIRNMELLNLSADRLQQLDPGGLGTEVCSVFAALSRGQFREARRHFSAARAAGLSAEGVRDIESFLDRAEPIESRYGLPMLGAIAVWAALLALLLFTGDRLSARTLKAARQMAADKRATPADHLSALRSVYRGVLWLTCAVFYLSLPLVVLLVVGAAYALWLGFAALGRIPIKLAMMVGLVVLVSLWAIVKSLWAVLVRGKVDDPGIRLDLTEHPRFAAALHEAADRVGTRPVDTVFLTPGTQVAVYEKSGLTGQISGRSERCLILGIGVLDGMTQAQLKAVLAHEYGHFVNRDTAGGGLALAVRRSIMQMARSLAAGGAAAWYNPAWLFVINFHKLFLRVSQGASRLQETLADRWAALAYGGANFAAGLRHTVARSVQFEKHAEATLREVIDGKLPLRNLYRYTPVQLVDASRVTSEVEKAMSADPSPYDSHPRPADRIAWVGDLSSTHLDIGGDAPAWQLFADREALEQRLTDDVRANVAARHGVEIPGEAASEREEKSA
jgi:Zn-dependent protease with chaperone function